MGMPWLVLTGSACPGCGMEVSGSGAVTHECGERLEVTKISSTLVLIVRYPAGYVAVRSDRWDHYLVKTPRGLTAVKADSRLPLSTAHAAPWVIWSGEGEPRPNWVQADQCPECGKAHRGNENGTTFRCECRARLLPLPAETIDSFTKEMVVGKLWDEQALMLKSAGSHLLLSVLTFPLDP